MITGPLVGNAAPGASRRRLYRQSKRLLVRLLSRRLKGPRDALEPAVRRFLRARPRSYLSRLCPNEFKPRLGNSGHKIDIALVGTAEFDVTEVDFATILLSRADGVGGVVLPERVRVKDRATPFDGEPCGCHELKKDGIDDLRMRFFAVDMTVVLELDTLPEGASVELVVTGNLLDGPAFTASDCIVIDDPPGHDDDSSDDSSDDDSDDNSDGDSDG